MMQLGYPTISKQDFTATIMHIDIIQLISWYRHCEEMRVLPNLVLTTLIKDISI